MSKKAPCIVLGSDSIMNPFFLKYITIHKDWLAFFTEENLNLLKNIESQVLVSSSYTPPTDKVLRFLELPLSSAKIIILGQDPYPQPGIATGRAFEVGNLKSWDQKFKNISLKNILRTLYKAYTGKILKYNELKEKIKNEFPVLPPDKLFQHWERQGVLLLNTSFTCETGNPGSHRINWESFTFQLLRYINENSINITWFLWGNQAQKATEHIDLQNVIATMHPMMCYDMSRRNKDFLYGDTNCFEPFISEIDWTGYSK